MVLGQGERNVIEAYIAHRSVAIGWRVGCCIANGSLARYGAGYRSGHVGSIIMVVVGIVGHRVLRGGDNRQQNCCGGLRTLFICGLVAKTRSVPKCEGLLPQGHKG